MVLPRRSRQPSPLPRRIRYIGMPAAALSRRGAMHKSSLRREAHAHTVRGEYGAVGALSNANERSRMHSPDINYSLCRSSVARHGPAFFQFGGARAERDRQVSRSPISSRFRSQNPASPLSLSPGVTARGEGGSRSINQAAFHAPAAPSQGHGTEPGPLSGPPSGPHHHSRKPTRPRKVGEAVHFRFSGTWQTANATSIGSI